ncbi:MAG: Holliday junction branch migration protein RuvA, partial [Actinomycetota bacterium]
LADVVVDVDEHLLTDVAERGGRRRRHRHPVAEATDLYGFTAREERVCFEALLSAHGVGPALALAILSVHDPAALRQVLADEDTAALCLVPGVGKKTAERLVMELKSKLGLPELEPSSTAVDVTDDAHGRRDVIDALAELGYGAEEVRAVVADLPADGDPSDLLRTALQRLSL